MSDRDPETVVMPGYAMRWDEQFAPGAVTQEQLDAAIARGMPVTRNFRSDEVLGRVISAKVDDVGVEVTASLSLSPETAKLLCDQDEPFAFGGVVKRRTDGRVDAFDVLATSIARERWHSALQE